LVWVRGGVLGIEERKQLRLVASSVVRLRVRGTAGVVRASTARSVSSLRLHVRV
jgi:hypothetical protein